MNEQRRCLQPLHIQHICNSVLNIFLDIVFSGLLYSPHSRTMSGKFKQRLRPSFPQIQRKHFITQYTFFGYNSLLFKNKYTNVLLTQTSAQCVKRLMCEENLPISLSYIFHSPALFHHHPVNISKSTPLYLPDLSTLPCPTHKIFSQLYNNL